MPRRRAIAEALGTFVLVFCGVGSTVFAGGVIGALGVALAFGLSLLAMAFAIGPSPAARERSPASRSGSP